MMIKLFPEAKTWARHRSSRLSGMLAISLVLGLGLLNPVVSLEAHPVQSESKSALKTVKGKASYYGARFHGRTTASGRKFNINALVADHPSWPFGTVVRVANLKNKRSVNMEIIDRGPARRTQRRGVIIDLSRKTAQTLDFIKQGKTDVRLEVLTWGKGRGRR
jgi:rare lipoprotein A